MQSAVRFTRAIALLLAAAGLSACGTGNQQPVASASTNSLSFSVLSPDAPTPSPQTINASVSPGTVSVAILHGGSAIASASYTLSGNTVQIVVDPASPATLGAGDFSGTVTVTGYSCGNPGCSQLVSGNSQVIAVTYDIPPIVRYVAPYVGIASGAPATASGAVIIRGQGFEQFPVQNVTFGGIAASTFSVVSDTEIQATYSLSPPAGSTYPVSYPVQIVVPNSPGAIVSEANLVVVPVPVYPATTLGYPAGVTVTGIYQLLYDAPRQALLLAVNTTSGTELLRYAYSGGSWSSTPANVSIASLSDIALSTQGNELLALSQQQLTQLDPTSLGTLTAYTPNPIPAPALGTGVYFKNLAVANDGNAVITTGNTFSSSTGTPLYLYSVHSPAFTQPATTPSLDNATPGASADGSLVALEQGDPSQASAPPFAYQYTAATETFAATGASVNAYNPAINNSIAPALDRSATRIVLNGTNVYGNGFNALGTLPGTTLAVVVSPDASCAYTYDSTSGQILAFSLVTPPAGGGLFPQVWSVTPASSPGVSTATIKMAISPDGGTLFLAGNSQIVVEPAAPTALCP
ncbi:MAG: hypothetical protein ACYDHM_04775 [Acidiferrobacterales bacterium]